MKSTNDSPMRRRATFEYIQGRFSGKLVMRLGKNLSYTQELTSDQVEALRAARSWRKVLCGFCDKMVPLQIAHHEAGHVVAALVQGLRVMHASLVPTNDSAGRIGWPSSYRLPATHERSVALRRKHMVVSFSGFVAERRFAPGALCVSMEADLDQAARMARPISRGKGALRAMLVSAERKAQSIITAHWSSVQRVAARLVDDATLLEHELLELVPAAHSRLKIDPAKEL